MNEGIRQTLYAEKKTYPTIVQYMDGTVSSLYLEGTVNQNSIPNKGNATYVGFSKSVDNIGSYALYGATNLSSVIIPNSVTAI